ncbi:MAG: tyrosine-protein phosphatase, partial [Pseudomonadota bacterium]
MKYLLEPFHSPRIPGVQIPDELYWIIDDPAPLAGMCRPRSDIPWVKLLSAGFGHVINLMSTSPDYDSSPLKMAYAVELQDLLSGGPPSDPEREEGLVREVVHVTKEILDNGEGVIIHCYGGKGRTGMVIGCLLREFGFSSSEIIAGLDRLQKSRGKAG